MSRAEGPDASVATSDDNDGAHFQPLLLIHRYRHIIQTNNLIPPYLKEEHHLENALAIFPQNDANPLITPANF